jgi:hypothetical protein
MAGLQSLVAEDTLWHLPGRDAVFEMFGRVMQAAQSPSQNATGRQGAGRTIH